MRQASRFGKSRKTTRNRGYRRRLRLEPLEYRLPLATFTVTNLEDDGPGSLRQAILDSNDLFGADEIVFASGVEGTIQLFSQPLQITGIVDIHGPGSDLLTIDAGGFSYAFTFSQNTFIPDVTLNDVTLNNGGIFGRYVNFTLRDSTVIGSINFADASTLLVIDSAVGGSVRMDRGTLTISNSTVAGAHDDGVAITDGVLHVDASVIVGNGAEGIDADDSDVVISNTIIQGNVRSGVDVNDSDLTITNSRILNNELEGVEAARQRHACVKQPHRWQWLWWYRLA